MLKASILAGAAALALAAPALAQTRAPAPAAPVADLVRAVDIPFQQFTLANGLRVIVHTDRKAPIVAVSIWYDIGSKHEPKDKTGFAHLFEHLMFNGSENAPGDFFEPLKQIGATDLNGTTWFDRTNYFETVPTAALDRALYLESDRMGYLLGAVTQGVLDEQRGVVQNEKRENDNQPYGLVGYRVTDVLFPNAHPYGHETIGSMADLDAASLQDVKDWFRNHYGPNNAVLVLAGDIDATTARPLVEKYFGKIARGPETRRPAAPVPSLPAPVAETMKDRVAQVMVTRNWAVPGLDDPQSAGLEVAAGVLGGLSSSRLNTALVKKEKLFVNVSVNNQAFAQVGTFSIYGLVRPGVDPAAAAKRLDALVAQFLAEGPSADEVNRFVTTAVAGRIRGLESVGGFGGKAVALAEGALYSNDPGFYKKQLQQLAQQTPATVKAAADRWLGRPVFALSVVPGERGAYAEAQVPAKAEVAAAPETPVKGTREPLPGVGELAGLAFPQVTRDRLANGVELIYAPARAVPMTQLVMSFDAGAAADVAGKLGTQDLTLAMLDEGTRTLDSVAIAEAKERLGAQISSGASADRTTVSLSVPSANLAPALDLARAIVREPAFAEAEVARVKNQQLAQIAQELTTPDGIAERVLPPLVSGASNPYSKDQGAGDPAAVAALTRADLVAFKQAWLRPDKLKIFVVSDRPLAEVKAALDARFGDWREGGTPGRKAFGALAPVSPRIVLVDRPDSPQSLIVGGDANALKGTDDLLPLTTANDALGGSFLGRINMDLRENKHWSYGAFGSFQRYEYAAPYVVQAPVQADKTGPALASLRAEIGNFVGARPMTQAEFERAVTGSVRSLPGNFETSGEVLGAMQNNDLFKRPDDYYATLPAKLRALTLPQTAAALKGQVDPAGFVWVVIGDAKVVRPQLDSLGLPVEVRPAASASGAAGGE